MSSLVAGPSSISKQPLSGGVVDLFPPVVNLNTIPAVSPLVRCHFSGNIVAGAFTDTRAQGMTVTRLGVGIFRCAFILQSTVGAIFAPPDNLYAVGYSMYQDAPVPSYVNLNFVDYPSKTRFGFDMYTYNPDKFTPLDPLALDIWVIY